ncbi:hypothetical protein [Cupriavidus plantarum]|uniref:hypothetical protein n=1 Tax=Cupriavidus plantarum TaxID=942865 RepID=UPI001BA64398|nr:hypothetical protein [Cupriavidus plantarum]
MSYAEFCGWSVWIINSVFGWFANGMPAIRWVGIVILAGIWLLVLRELGGFLRKGA